MRNSNMQPRIKFQNRGCGLKNRLGCVYETLYDFFRKRAVHAGGDTVSIILFNEEPLLLVERQPLDVGLADRLAFYGPSGGTHFGKALRKAKTMIQPGDSVALLFLSDGEDSFPAAEMQDLVNTIPDLQAHTVLFAPQGASGGAILKRMSDATAEGSFSHCTNGIGLRQHFGALASIGSQVFDVY